MRKLLSVVDKLAISTMIVVAAAVTPPVAASADGRQAVAAAQAAWCAGLIDIGATKAAGGDAVAAARAMLKQLYAFEPEPDADDVLFKPTLAHGAQTFRTDERGALAYFVGGDTRYPDDGGFALRPWTSCKATLAGVVEVDAVTVAMGTVTLGAADGDQVEVEKTFVYRRGDDGALRIIAHMSALPYRPRSD